MLMFWSVCVKTKPVIVAEICVQRVPVETQSHGGAQQLRDHLWRAEWGEDPWVEMTERYLPYSRFPPLMWSLYSTEILIQPLGSPALQRVSHDDDDVQSVSKSPMFFFNPCHWRTGLEEASVRRCGAIGTAGSGSELWASLSCGLPAVSISVCVCSDTERRAERGRRRHVVRCQAAHAHRSPEGEES